MDANESFEQAAEAFYKATGHLMPGKSIAAAAYAGEEAEEERCRLFKVWCAAIEYMKRPGGALSAAEQRAAELEGVRGEAALWKGCTQREQARAERAESLLAEVERRIERLATFHVPPDHEHESGTVNPDGDCWVCALQSPPPSKPIGMVCQTGANSKCTPIMPKPSEEKPDYYANGGGTTYKADRDPEATCWHCTKTFLCDPMDACCRLCGAPFDRNRCREFRFVPSAAPSGGEEKP